MKDEVKRWHSSTLSAHNMDMYDKLIFEHDVRSETMKEVVLAPLESTTTNTGDEKTHIGYFATKNKIKYFIGPKNYVKLPIKVKEYEEWKYREDVVFVPVKPIGFRIKPEHKFKFKEMIDAFAPFDHTEPDTHTLMKITAFMGDIGRTYTCMVTEPNGGKSSIYKLLHAVTNRCPVYQPRSIPGCMNKITGNGNIVWDDIINVPADARKAMEDMSMQIADGSTMYINGAIKSHQTKSKYHTPLQSLTFLYNNTSNYQNPDKKYFDVIFENNGAMDDRYLKMYFKGRMIQRFHRDFDIIGTAKDNQQYYINIAKELVWLQELKQSSGYVRRYTHNSILTLKSRKRLTYDEICWGIDMYCSDQGEYDKFVSLLDQSILDYKEMITSAGLVSTRHMNIEEEVIEE